MKYPLRKLFRPILQPFEKGVEDYDYKPLNRKLLLILAILFCSLAAAVAIIGAGGSGAGFVLPAIVFGGVGIVALVVATLGTDRAVAKIWRNR
ncbi:MAG: hypothetical protein M0Q95_14660 [Porticoccaceae bacterium]|nr:hypothetical protein [Porticoccaceae bacterium]